MRLTRATSYALHAMLHLASVKSDVPLASHQIAQARKVPERFLLKVMKPLVAAGLLHSVKGPHGGYRLARPASQITLLDIVEAVEGPIRGQPPYSALPGNHQLEKLLENICNEVAEKTRQYLKSVKLTELLEK
ncbi:MAG: Rrf2 family transcriptional regulator [Gemmataceae bacterium]